MRSETILNLAQEVKHDTTVLRTLVPIMKNMALSYGEEFENPGLESTQNQGLLFRGSMIRLAQLLGKQERTTPTNDAGHLIQDLEVILEHAKREGKRQGPVEIIHDSRNSVDDGGICEALRLTSTVTSLAPELHINRSASPLSGLVSQGMIVEQHRKYKVIYFDGAVVTTSSVERYSKRLQPKTIDEDANSDGINIVVSRCATLVFKLEHSAAMIETFVSQVQESGSSTSIPPQISVIDIRPRDSMIFQIAANGNVNLLMRFVCEGKGNLRDHDAWGWSLIHVGTAQTALIEYVTYTMFF
ncbi:hypothetical protein G7Z17_g5910 [Cylindrodendrum hubeiense]|uniref:Uncharacterized protein n=1 Tax=Cylindrodendrum hubeiense TaxID=595255 RepID=A0A9P5HC16_9HYPO|nr:hypothetical protein G7Z17_g5910 [Cylindrodendrum hubeiense]